MVYMLKDIDTSENLNKNELMLILKKEASNIGITDIMKACENFIFAACEK